MSMMLLPHVSSDLQSAEQPSPETVLLSSHASPTVPTTVPLPPGRHAMLSGSPPTALPSSHCSPFAVSMMPLPQVSFDLQSAEQPSPDRLLPSSHASSGVATPLPQPTGRHTMFTHSPSTVLPVASGYVHGSPVV